MMLDERHPSGHIFAAQIGFGELVQDCQHLITGQLDVLCAFELDEHLLKLFRQDFAIRVA
jgi:hypothetical protein